MNKFCVFTHEIVFGSHEIELLINDQVLRYGVGYTGVNPLVSLVDACFCLVFGGGEDTAAFEWELEPNILCFDLRLDASGLLHFDIVEYDDWDRANKRVLNEWHEAVPFDMFRRAVVAEGFRVLHAFGLAGFRASWMGEAEFPLAPLLRLTGGVALVSPTDSDSYVSSIGDEIACLSAYVGKNELTEESHIGMCNIYHHAWQSCGEPFGVGEKVCWTCVVPPRPTNVSDMIVDFTEEHHGRETHSISGVVDKIMMERRVEFSTKEKGMEYDSTKEKGVKYYSTEERGAEYISTEEKNEEDDAYYISHDEIQYANGWESTYPGDAETSPRTLLGYIVTLRDVTIKPLSDQNNDTE